MAAVITCNSITPELFAKHDIRYNPTSIIYTNNNLSGHIYKILVEKYGLGYNHNKNVWHIAGTTIIVVDPNIKEDSMKVLANFLESVPVSSLKKRYPFALAQEDLSTQDFDKLVNLLVEAKIEPSSRKNYVKELWKTCASIVANPIDSHNDKILKDNLGVIITKAEEIQRQNFYNQKEENAKTLEHVKSEISNHVRKTFGLPLDLNSKTYSEVLDFNNEYTIRVRRNNFDVNVPAGVCAPEYPVSVTVNFYKSNLEFTGVTYTLNTPYGTKSFSASASVDKTIPINERLEYIKNNITDLAKHTRSIIEESYYLYLRNI